MTTTIASLHEQATAQLAEVLQDAAHVDIVDFPDYLNCGDAAIWQGQRTVLQGLGIGIRSAMSRRSFDPGALSPDGTVLIQGGGNFGGLYPTHHALRLKLLECTRGRPLIQLPQSIQYPGPEQRDELRRAIAAHGAFVMLVRDHRSFDIATADFDCEVRLVPDAALALGPLVRRAPTVATAVQVRDDREATDAAAIDGLRFDWLTAPLTEDRRRRLEGHLLLARAARKSGAATLRRAELASGNRLAAANVTRAIRLLSAGRRLVTDRLHGHILATLLGVEHVVVNDKYGKIQAFWDTWTSGIPHAHFVDGWADAPAALTALQAEEAT
ncbi:polysaccharide pyruvyl transferase family protein [Gryllotalpicola koreensis]|uniref:Polysaccharide pyruvyl transferase family protein n=1 Tax=Gryllotalpicola koreensis TaxID=993086 RepID=A0ABP7ZTZ9_9MICO